MEALIKSLINCSTLYRREPHLTFITKYQGKGCVLKLIYNEKNLNNEAVITSMLHQYKPQLYPRVIFLDRSQPWDLVIGLYSYTIIETLCIEMVPEMTLGVITDADKLRLQAQLDEMHHLGIIHGDVHYNNIVRQLDGNVFLTDYGNSYRPGDPLLPPTTNAITDDNRALMRL